ncbi:uncharacterized protein [Physcomitrium patens]|uniref:uncharacterized protein isoform X2 n=1 Tax=Physcomitrium patens TaxID=3218 RepID=UPI003CCCA2E5
MYWLLAVELAMDHFLLSDILQPTELFPFFTSFTTRWRTLKAPDFQNLTFERAVDSIRSAATIHLWKIVTKEPKAASIERMRITEFGNFYLSLEELPANQMTVKV